jgi:DNA mismatch repair protein MutL
MGRIALLADEVASQVAAGEVVERPASAVKELVENSLDAGATRIDVAIRRGGISLVRVQDDGFGMDRDDALLCLERHATSKIRTGRDLASVATLGFRGEALPSIASVSRFRLATREREAVAGTEVIVSGGKIEAVRDAGIAPGTEIEVRHLFFNLPARRKFLRTETTEQSHVEHQLMLQAVAHPGVGLKYAADDRVVWQLAAARSLRERIRDLAGEAFVADLLEVEEEEFGGIRIRGYIGRPGVGRSTRAQQLIFVNGRPVDNPVIGRGLREGYHTALMKGQYPVSYLFLEMDPAGVDVNVHPAKREVRFRDGNSVREAVVAAVRRAIEGGRGRWSSQFDPGSTARPAEPAAGGMPAETPPLIPEREQRVLRRDWAELPAAAPGLAAPPQERLPEAAVAIPAEPVGAAPSGEPAPAADAAPARPMEFRILGVLGKLYVLMENAGGLVLVDQHAAHERILFERVRAGIEAQGVPSQRLLMPFTLQVPARDADWLARNLTVLQRMGIGIEAFGRETFKIDALPPFVKAEDPAQMLRDVIDELREEGGQSRTRLGEDLIAKTVCRAAVKANDPLQGDEIVRLIRDLLACELPYCCPHGRPTMIQIGYGELERKFGRRV